MLTSVEARTPQDDVQEFSLQDILNGYIISEIEGLEPVKATVVSSSFASMDGETFQAARREKRNIVIHIDLEPDWTTSTVTQLRQRLYDFFMPKSYVTLRFNSEEAYMPMVEIGGIVEDFQSPLFAQAPTATISVLCMLPDFVDPNQVVLAGSTVNTSTDGAITYSGTIETGFELSLSVNQSLSEFTIYSTGSDGNPRSMRIVASLLAGDVVEVSTIAGEKRVYLNRAGSQYSILYALGSSDPWIQLLPGTNLFRVQASGASIPFTLSYFNKYGGL